MVGKPVKLNDGDKKALKILRSKGLVPKDWKVSQITDYKKRQLRKTAIQYSNVIEKPKDYDSRKVSAKTAEKMKSAGYVVTGNARTGTRVLLPAKGVDNQRIRNGKLIITRKKRIETVYLTGGIDLLESLAERMNGQELKDNEFWTLKIGSRMAFMEQQFQSIEDTIDYYYAVEAYLSTQQKHQLQLVKVELI
jgi:hypothetical protein